MKIWLLKNLQTTEAHLTLFHVFDRQVSVGSLKAFELKEFSIIQGAFYTFPDFFRMGI